MAPDRASQTEPRWWRRPWPSFGVLAGLLVAVLVVIALLGSMVGDSLPDVGRDDAGHDSWQDPLAVQEAQEGLLVAVLPECAAGPITRIVLWDADSKPYWEISGPPRPLGEFVVGLPIEGFETVVPYSTPPRDATVRLVVFRRLGKPVGLRYRYDEVDTGKLMGGDPLRTYSKDGWLRAGVCESGSSSTGDDAATTTTAGA